MKKIFAVLFALTLVLSLGVSLFTSSVSADEVKPSWTGDITINGTAAVPVTGKTFKAYKILNAEAVDVNDLSKGVIYSIPAEMQGFYDTLLGKTATIEDVLAYLDEDKNADLDLQAFAVDAWNYAKNKVAAATATNDDDANKAEFTGLEFGYYVINDEGGATPISAMMLKSTAAEINLKADKPSIDKKIDGNIDQDITTGVTDETPDGLVDYNTAKVGDVVPYVLTSKVPDMTGYTSYTYIVTDTFSDGLTFNNDVAITIGGVNYTDFTVEQNDQVVTITFNNFIAQNGKKDEAAEIVITYSATVNENAVFGIEGNPNEVYLTFSNNPQDTSSNEDTNKDIVYTYLVDLIINKTDENGNSLAGASFDLYFGDDVIASGVSDINGLVAFTWVDGVKGLRDGETYTIVESDAPTGYNKAKDISFTVKCIDPAADATVYTCVWETTNDEVAYDDEDDRLESTIKNTTGFLLPETGGIGTTIFYVVGTLLMVVAGVILVSKKRMGNYA